MKRKLRRPAITIYRGASRTKAGLLNVNKAAKDIIATLGIRVVP